MYLYYYLVNIVILMFLRGSGGGREGGEGGKGKDGEGEGFWMGTEKLNSDFTNYLLTRKYF